MTKKKDKGRIWIWLVLILVALAAALTGYIIGKQHGREDREFIIGQEAPIMKKPVPKTVEETPPEKEAEAVESIPERPLEGEDYCRRIENDFQDFFKYLDRKNYIRHLDAGSDTHARFEKILKALSANPPIPAGEGIDSGIITKNIFHLFRVLDRNDIRLLREVMRNEADSWEINLDIFYRWTTLQEQCPNRRGEGPSLDVLYQYAGFFLNTIGGRAYIYRRPLGVRLLVSYYCLLILHDADRSGKNTYGIDVLSYVAPLLKEMEAYPGFSFREEYIRRLKEISAYYLQRR